MVIKNSFYLSKAAETAELFPGYSWESGQWLQISDTRICSTPEIVVKSSKRFRCEISYTNFLSGKLYFFDSSKKVLGAKNIEKGEIDEVLLADVSYLAIEITFTESIARWFEFKYLRLFEVNPHYKTLKKEYKKENGQAFFRESLDGKVSLWGSDYRLVQSASIEDQLFFYVYQDDKVYATNKFNKTDCQFNQAKGSVDLKLEPIDSYSKLLDNYKSTYDLLKLPVGKAEVQLTKRGIIQMYIQGENTVTSYAGGTYWEDEVIEKVDSESALQNKYYFSKGPRYVEVSLSGFDWPINAAYRCIAGQSVWYSTSIITGILGEKLKYPCCIKFNKEHSKGETDAVISLAGIYRLSDGTTSAVNVLHTGQSSFTIEYLYDTYRIEIYSGDENGTLVYRSKHVYGNDSNFMPKQGSGLYEMQRVLQDAGPDSFYLGANIIEYQIWGRLVCDSERPELYDLPYDDFITERANFKKCIGLVFSENANSLVHFVQSQDTQENPTPYGLSEYGEYFKKPRVVGSMGNLLYAYPFAKSSWGNTSLWVAFDETDESIQDYGLENWMKSYYRMITHKDFMEIGAVIKALLNKLDSSIIFESTAEYSEFLYGSAPDSYGEKQIGVYITPKSNILKGEYDQAAQKAEITFEQVMNMMRDCFRCYWYVDSNKRFRVEHIRYFMQGLSYSEQNSQVVWLQKVDKFNKKPALYGQKDIAFNKNDLSSRYEFAWADDASEAMGQGFYIDIQSNYVESDKIENVNVDLFSADIDLMMFVPNKFSQDGFALVLAENPLSPKVPIIRDSIYDQRDSDSPMILYTQNYYASFIKLFDNYLYDMPAKNITSSCEPEYQNFSSRYSVNGLKKSMEQNVSLPINSSLDVYSTIKTDIGIGQILGLSVNIDTKIVELILAYEPK